MAIKAKQDIALALSRAPLGHQFTDRQLLKACGTTDWADVADALAPVAVNPNDPSQFFFKASDGRYRRNPLATFDIKSDYAGMAVQFPKVNPDLFTDFEFECHLSDTRPVANTYLISQRFS